MRTALPWALSVVLVVSCSRSSSPAPEPPGAPAARPPAAPEPAPPALPPARAVTFTTEDGVTLVGELQPAPASDAPLVILVHQLQSDRSEWAPLSSRLHEDPAIATLTFDLRGHGQSTVGPNGALDFHAFTPEDWQHLELDVIAALRFVTGLEGELTPSRIGAVGSSIGSSAVIAAAAREGRLSTLVAISPGRAYHGVDALTPMVAVGVRPFLALVAQGETENVETAAAMARITHGESIVVDGDAHGVALFAADPSTLDRTVGFLRDSLTAVAPPVVVPPAVEPPAAVEASGEPAPTGR